MCVFRRTICIFQAAAHGRGRGQFLYFRLSVYRDTTWYDITHDPPTSKVKFRSDFELTADAQGST